MAVFTDHNLYPGKIDTAMPGFIVNDIFTCTYTQDDTNSKYYFFTIRSKNYWFQETLKNNDIITVDTENNTATLNRGGTTTSLTLHTGTISGSSCIPLTFVNTTISTKVYFSITEHNAIEDIKSGQYLQVSLRYQTTNENALSDASGIVLKTILNDNDGKGYYFLLNAEDLAKKDFIPYIYYKLQFRLTDAGATSKNNSQTIDTWLMATNGNGKTNLDNSSEWSTVCLLRAITDFDLQVDGWGAGSEDSVNPTTATVSNIYDIIGRINFTDSSYNGTEYLKYINISWADKNSGNIYTNSYNDIYNYFAYDFVYNFKAADSPYIITITATTNTLCQKTFYYSITINPGTETLVFNPVVKLEPLEEEGAMKMTLEYLYSTASKLLIYRMCAQDNYERKEKIYEGDLILLQEEDSTVSYLDVSLESGLLYKYVFLIKQGTNISNETEVGPAGVVFDHMFLNYNNQQLKIKFNPQISSMKTIYSENKTETIGSQFPFIRRNTAVKYKTFPISGLISYFMDEDHLFSSREYEYGTNLNAYNTFNDNNGIIATTDYTYERLFRDRVQNFLENGEVKLFKSPTEGNILVRLMDISFTPNQTTGRMLYSFSATAYEMAEMNMKNMEKYHINAIISNNYGTDNYNTDPVNNSIMDVAQPNYAVNYTTSSNETKRYKFEQYDAVKSLIAETTDDIVDLEIKEKMGWLPAEASNDSLIRQEEEE